MGDGHLASKGMSCPLPVAARDGSILKVNDRPCAIFSFLDGTSSRYQTAENVEHLVKNYNCTLMQWILILTGKMRLGRIMATTSGKCWPAR